MNEHPRTDDESALPPDPAPGSDPEPAPRYPGAKRAKRQATPETLAKNPEVTPLDPDRNLEEGIDVEER